MDLTVGSRHYHVSLLVLLCVALGLLWVSTRGGGGAETDPAQSWVAAAGKYRWTLRGLSGQVATHLHHEARLAQDTTRLRVARDSALQAALRLAQSVDSLHRAPLTAAVRRIGEACGEYVQSCEQRVGLALQALETEHAKVNLMGTRLAGADTVIAALRRVTQCQFVFLKCPSRTKVAELAVLVGFALGLVAHR